MRLHALIFALFVLGAHTASIPDKKDIEKKLAAVVKEVLNKDEVPLENVSSEQELIEPANGVKDVENNLKKSALPSDIPVKVVVEDVKPALKTDDKKEDNEVSPASEESSEIVREEIDLKNPGPPQRMQHDTQAPPEHIQDAQQLIILKNNEWRGKPEYIAVQTEIQNLKDSFENKMTELYESLQVHWSTHPAEKEEENIKVRASVREEASSTTNAPGQWGSNPFTSWFQNWQQQMQGSFNQLNATFVNFANNTANSNTTNNGCSGGSSPTNIFNSWGNNNQQADEASRPTLWQNVQNFFQNPLAPPANAQSDSPQPAQPGRPVIQAITNAVNGFFSPGQSEQQKPQQQQQQPSPATTQEGANAVPAENVAQPDGQSQKQKPEQATVAAPPSSPITQMIGNNPVVQGLAGAVQRIQHAIIPTKPRNDVTKSAAEKEVHGTKGGWLPPPPTHSHGSGAPGDNNISNSSGVDSKPEATAEKDVIAEPTKEEKTPELQKTE